MAAIITPGEVQKHAYYIDSIELCRIHVLCIFPGLPKTPTHTTLAATVTAGSDTITVQDATNWVVGDEIVIATTGHRHSQSENEQRTITAVNDDGTEFTLDVSYY